jgi:chromosome segregation protein
VQITKLRLSGFKSFVHPTELLIESGLTGVVGPNGCGKSNLVEALRWVMGETSARGLRGGEMDDVIFAGTAARPAHDLADVTVQLRRIDRALAQFGDDDELELNRRIGRGVGSVFRVNGREIRARDVQLMFADASSGARSAAIVSQGQIGGLVEAKPTDRRRLLEAAAGVAGLQARRHEAELKLRATEANLVRLQDLLTALEEQHRSLRKQARQAERYRELSAAHREAEAALLIGRWQTARVELAAAEQIFRQGQEEIAERTRTLEQARARRDETASVLPALRQSEAALATELARLAERLSALVEELSRLDQTKTQLAERRQQIDQDVAHANTTLSDAAAMRQRLEEERDGLVIAAERCAAELERSAAAERAGWDELEAADGAFREALAAVAETEARLGQLAERRREIAQRRDELHEAEQQAQAAMARLGDQPEAAANQERSQAEAALAQASAAAEAADAALRVAERSHLLARQRDLAARSEQSTERRRALGLAELEQRMAAAKAAAEQAEAELAVARQRAREAEESRNQAEAGLREQEVAVERLRAEADALAALVAPKATGASVIDRVEVQDGYAEALAAALGDDLVGSLDPAAPVHWREDTPAPRDAPALPDGCTPLGRFVGGLPALARRLDQIGVADPATAAALQGRLLQGQRLVSKDGGLWRWDGFVRLPEASGSGATRLHQRARLRQLDDQCAQQATVLSARREELASVDQTVRDAHTAREQAEGALRTASLAFETARDAATQARATDTGLAAELTALAEEKGRVEQELSEFGCNESERGDLPGTQELSPEDAKAARAEARAAASAARERLAAAQAEIERCRAAEHAAALASREQELERTRVHARQAQLQQDRAALDQAEQEVVDTQTLAESDLAAAQQRLAEARSTLAQRRQSHTEASAEHVRLRDRQASAAQRHASLCGELELWAERARNSEARLTDLDRRRGDLAAEITRLVELPAILERQQAEQQARIGEIEAERATLGEQLQLAETAAAEAQRALEQAETERVDARETGARLEGRLEQARAELASAESAVLARLPQLPDTLPGVAPDAEELAELEATLDKLGLARERLGAVNLRALEEVQELAMRIETLQAEQTELTAAIERLRRAIATLNREGRERLRAAFAKVEEHFEALFVRLFGGGRAKLELTDLEDPLAAGLELAASPPGKKLQSVSLLSGGEKALTAIALIFAVFLTRPSPLCILDEVDAPLDDANVQRLGALLEELAQSTETRFVVITHHPLTMARMDRLYGVTMAERGISELVSVDLRTAVELRATAQHAAA